MARKIEVPENTKDLPLAVVKQMLSLATSGFALVAALAWNELVKESISTFIKPYLPEGSKVISLLIYAIIVTVLSGVTLFGHQRAERAFNYYRVVDGQVLAALDWLRDQGAPGDRVIANETPRGGILGWWVEGYARLPTYLAVDTRWFSFRDERSQAEIAHRFLSADTGPEELGRLAETHQIKFLLLKQLYDYLFEIF